MRTLKHKTDLCVIGGGLSGMCAAISAARHGLKVILIHDRPVFGGNASSEIRMWICGARGENNRETGIIEEIILENMYRNPESSYSIWDSILYEKIKQEKNITYLLNCSCLDVVMEGLKIVSVKGWQLTNETWHIIQAKMFADCSGDSILSTLTGAEYRMGREASSEFGESIQPKIADNKTMGMSCLIQARETNHPSKFIPPEWANKYENDSDLPFRDHFVQKSNYWWIELGGDAHSIHDTEEIRDELLKIAFGVWDHIKNYGDHRADNWVLDWVGFLPGKRESRRYIGDYILTQNDINNQVKFNDIVAYGGWPMDDHHPEGFKYPGHPTIFHEAKSPFGIPYRCLYSKNIENLYFAGRNVSVSHAALSSTRVMATCALMGQASGTAAAIAVKNGISPRNVYIEKIAELKEKLMQDDCYLPWNIRNVSGLTKKAALSASEGNAEVLRSGIDRPIGASDNGWHGKPGSWIKFEYEKAEKINGVRLIFDSDLNRQDKDMPCCYPIKMERKGIPPVMTKSFRIEVIDDNGIWNEVKRIDNNYQRLVNVSLDIPILAKAIRIIPESTWGAELVHIFATDII